MLQTKCEENCDLTAFIGLLETMLETKDVIDQKKHEDTDEDFLDDKLPRHYWAGDDGCELIFED